MVDEREMIPPDIRDEGGVALTWIRVFAGVIAFVVMIGVPFAVAAPGAAGAEWTVWLLVLAALLLAILLAAAFRAMWLGAFVINVVKIAGAIALVAGVAVYFIAAKTDWLVYDDKPYAGVINELKMTILFLAIAFGGILAVWLGDTLVRRLFFRRTEKPTGEQLHHTVSNDPFHDQLQHRPRSRGPR